MYLQKWPGINLHRVKLWNEGKVVDKIYKFWSYFEFSQLAIKLEYL